VLTTAAILPNPIESRNHSIYPANAQLRSPDQAACQLSSPIKLRKFQVPMRLKDTTHSREWMPMISQATLAAAVGLKGLIVAGVFLQIAIVTRLTVSMAWEQASEMWNQWRAS
jgi:hypothetical protein